MQDPMMITRNSQRLLNQLTPYLLLKLSNLLLLNLKVSIFLKPTLKLVCSTLLLNKHISKLKRQLLLQAHSHFNPNMLNPHLIWDLFMAKTLKQI